MRILFILSLIVNILVAITMLQAWQQDRSFSGVLRWYDECQAEIGIRQELMIYANSNELCESLMALPNNHRVELKW
jgi:hypothetical protein